MIHDRAMKILRDTVNEARKKCEYSDKIEDLFIELMDWEINDSGDLEYGEVMVFCRFKGDSVALSIRCVVVTDPVCVEKMIKYLHDDIDETYEREMLY